MTEPGVNITSRSWSMIREWLWWCLWRRRWWWSREGWPVMLSLEEETGKEGDVWEGIKGDARLGLLLCSPDVGSLMQSLRQAMTVFTPKWKWVPRMSKCSVTKCRRDQKSGRKSRLLLQSVKTLGLIRSRWRSRGSYCCSCLLFLCFCNICLCHTNSMGVSCCSISFSNQSLFESEK